MCDSRHLHPAAAIILSFRTVRQFIFPFVVVAVTQFGERGLKWFLVAGGVLLGFAVVWGVLAWRRFTYRVEEGELRIEYGVIIRNRRFIPQERIQSIDLIEPLLHRVFRVVNVRVETAGGGAPEGLLVAVSRADAEALRAALMVRPVAAEEQDEEKVDESRCLRRMTRQELFIAGATSGSVGIVFSLAGGAFSFIETALPTFDLFGMIDRAIAPWLAQFAVSMVVLVGVMVLIAFVIAWMVAVIGTVFTYAGFSVKRVDDDLIIERGLIERRRSTIPLSRIQAIRIVEGVLRQPLGFVTLHVESAGYGELDGESTVLFPLMKWEEVEPFLQQAAPEFAAEVKGLKRLPRRARRRFVIRSTVPALIIAGMVSVFVFPVGLFLFGILPLAGLYGLLRYRDSGWRLSGETLLLRTRTISRTTAIVTRRRVQSCDLARSYFQRRKRLATFRVSVASGAIFSMIDLDQATGTALYDWV